MRPAFRVLAFVIAAEVVVQAAAIVYAVAGLGKWIMDCAVVDKAVMESDDTAFTGIGGFIVHGMNGMMIMPFLALVLLIVSFFAKVPKGPVYAGGILALVILQVVLGIYGHEVPAVGALHGINAFVIFIGALQAGMAAGRQVETPVPTAA
jgi:hypothetical protein